MFYIIRRIHPEDTAYLCLLFTDNQEGLKTQYAVKMDDPNITIKEYIRLEVEKARRRSKVYNWETATYGINTAYPGEWIRRIDFLYSLGPREGNIDEYWWRIYESGNLEVLES
ncbi:hypothetical protein Tco_0466444 [Tanacetum coccineum]